MDALQDQNHVAAFAALQAIADGLRNDLEGKYGVSAAVLLTDKVQLLALRWGDR